MSQYGQDGDRILDPFKSVVSKELGHAGRFKTLAIFAAHYRSSGMAREVDYKSSPIDPGFLDKRDDYPVTGEHRGHQARAQGKARVSGDGVTPYPTSQGIHGTQVAVDWEACIANGTCMDVCPVSVFEWTLTPGQAGTGKDKNVEKGTQEWNEYRTDKSDPSNERDCIFCMACETQCPTTAIKITPP